MTLPSSDVGERENSLVARALSTRRRVDAALVFLAALSSAGCFVDAHSVPSGEKLSCTSNADCPGDLGFVCHEGACTAAASIDATAPVVTAQLDPSAATVGDVVTLTLSSSEPLGALPGAHIGDVPFSITGGAVGDTVFTLAVTVDPTMPEGTATVIADGLVDAAGNAAPDVNAGDVTLDFHGPVVVGAPVVAGDADPLAAGPGQTITLHFTLDDAAAETPVVTSAVSGGTAVPWVVDAASSSGNDWVFTVVPEPSFLEGRHDISISAVDALGNVAVSSGGHIDMDFTPPSVVFAAAQVLAPPGHDPFLPAVDLADNGSARIVFNVSELLSARDVSATCPGPAGPLTGALTDISLAGSTLAFVYLGSVGDVATRDCDMTIDMTDLHGNSAHVVESGIVHADGDAPLTDLVDAGDFVHVRTPWGSTALAEPAQFLSGPGVGVDGTMSPISIDDIADAGDDIRQIRVYASLVDQQPIGVLPVKPDHTADPTRLFGDDSPRVFITLVDAAGNESARAAVVDGIWVATLDGKVAGSDFENPHDAEERGAFDFTVAPVTGRTLDTSDGIGHTGDVLQRKAQASAARVDGHDLPPLRVAAASAYDEARHRFVFISGSGDASEVTVLPDVWEWTGTRFVEVVPADPEGDGSPGTIIDACAAYDFARDQVIVHGGGNASNTLAQTWAYDGTSFRVVANGGTGAPHRRRASLAFDPVRERVVLFGGIDGTTFQNDFWEWDGTTWTQAAPVAVATPSPRANASLVYDEHNATMFLYGGVRDASAATCGDNGNRQCADVWTYDGTNLTQITPGGAVSPAGRSSAVAVFDRAAQRVLVLGGDCGVVGAHTTCTDSFSWDGAAFSTFATDASVARAGASAAFLDHTGQVVEFGGAQGVVLAPDLRAVSSPASSLLAPRPVAAPPPRDGAATAFDPVHARTVLFAGDALPATRCFQASGADGPCADLWQFDGFGWTLVAADTTAAPFAIPPRSNAAMAFDPSSQKLVFFGGSSLSALTGDCVTSGGDHPCGGVWTVDSDAAGNISGFTRVKDDGAGASTQPLHREDAIMVTDPVAGRVLLFGGNSPSQACDGLSGINNRCGALWQWQSGAWTLLEPATDDTGATSPRPRNFPRAAFDEPRDVLVVFGGTESGTNDDSVWEWSDALGWREFPRPAGTVTNVTWPDDNGHMGYDPHYDGVVLVHDNITFVWNPNHTWTHLDYADPDADGDIDTTAAAAFSDGQGLLVVATDKNEADPQATEVWRVTAPGDELPAHIFRARFATAGLPVDGRSIESVNVVAIAGGTSRSEDGAVAYLWSSGAYREVAHNDVDAPALFFGSGDERALVGPAQEVRVALTPKDVGAVGAAAAVSTDIIEVAVRYTLTGP